MCVSCVFENEISGYFLFTYTNFLLFKLVEKSNYIKHFIFILNI